MQENASSPNLAHTTQASLQPYTRGKKFLLGIAVLFAVILLFYMGYLWGTQSVKRKIQNQYSQITTQPSIMQPSPTTQVQPSFSPQTPTPVDETSGFHLYAYENNQYGFTFYYPPTYNIKNAADPQICRSFYKTGRQPNCLLGIKLLPQNTSLDFIPPAYFYLLGNINAISFPGQIGEIKFDPQKKVWIWFGASQEKTLSVWGSARSGHQIILGENGGSHSSSNYYIIPRYQKNLLAVFIIPKSYRLRCDLINETIKQKQCSDFYRSVIQKYNQGQITVDSWLPANYIKSLYQEAEVIIKSFAFSTAN